MEPGLFKTIPIRPSEPPDRWFSMCFPMTEGKVEAAIECLLSKHLFSTSHGTMLQFPGMNDVQSPDPLNGRESPALECIEKAIGKPGGERTRQTFWEVNFGNENAIEGNTLLKSDTILFERQTTARCRTCISVRNR
jgi:hypothetical protein